MNQIRYNELKIIVQKITKSDTKYEDLFHDTLIQLLQNKTFTELEHKQQTYFFVRSIMNQFFSTTSYYHRTYKRNGFIEFDFNMEIVDENYDEKPTLDWIYETLDIELMNNPNSWYNVGLYKLFLELKKINKVHERTKIPKYSIRNTIKEMKEFLNDKWKQYKNGKN